MQRTAAAQPLQTALLQAHSALITADKQGQSDATLDQLATTEGPYAGQLAAVHAKAEKQVYAILTPDQQAKYDKLAGAFGLVKNPGN